MAAARAIADIVSTDELREDYIIPSVFNRDVVGAVASAVAEEARESGDRRGGGRDRVRLDRGVADPPEPVAVVSFAGAWGSDRRPSTSSRGVPAAAARSASPTTRQQQPEGQADALAVALALGQPRAPPRGDQPDEQEVQRLGADQCEYGHRLTSPGTPRCDFGIVAELVGVVGERDAPGLEHVAAVGDLERVVGVLLDEQDRDALAVDLARSSRRSAGPGSARSPSRARRAAAARGRAISARPIASICCSPPDIVPAFWFSRSWSRGNSSKTRSRSSEVVRTAPVVGAEIEVLADRHPGEAVPALGRRARCPRSTIWWAGTRVMSSPPKRDRARARRRQPRDRAQRRRLPGPVGADQRDDLALLDGQRHALQRLDLAVVRVDVVDLEQRPSRPCFPR